MSNLNKLKKRIADLETDLEEAMDPIPFVAQAELVLAKMASDMPRGIGWLDAMKDQVLRNFQVLSPIGRPRNLFRAMTGSPKYIAEAGRRAKNSPIQGISSEIGVVSCYLSYSDCYKYSRRPKALARSKLFSKATRLVHDASYYCTPYHLVIPQIQIGLYNSTSGLSAYYEKTFGFKMLSAPEVELEMCAREDKTYKWDWTLPELGKIVRKSLEDQKELGYLDDVDFAMKEIFWCWLDKEERTFLWDNYPFLDVPYSDVKDQLILMLKEQDLI